MSTNLVALNIDKTTGRIVAKPGNNGGGSSTLAGLNDVDVSGVVGGQYLMFNGTKWVPTTPPGGASILNHLLDVEVVTPADDDVLTYQSGIWTNRPGGSGGNNQGIVLHQTTPASVWTIAHSRTTRNVIVQTYDDLYEMMIPAKIIVADINTVRVEFPTPLTGYAHLMFFQTV
jgi:hypothetical protein